MKRLAIPLLCLLYLLTLSGCLYAPDEKAYKNAVTSLFKAVDNKNSEAIYDLFSPYVRKNNKNLKEEIDKLLSVYSGPTDEINCTPLDSTEERRENFKRSGESYATFPIRSGNMYYWCYLKLIYRDDFDKENEGIVEIDFFTADEYCIDRYFDNEEYDDNTKEVDSVGVHVYADDTIPEEVRCVNRYPYKYSTSTKPLNIDDVKAFFKTSTDFSEFKKQFGQPNAELDFSHIYELPKQNGKIRYLEIGVDYETDIIFNAEIVDDFNYIDTIYSKKE